MKNERTIAGTYYLIHGGTTINHDNNVKEARAALALAEEALLDSPWFPEPECWDWSTPASMKLIRLDLGAVQIEIADLLTAVEQAQKSLQIAIGLRTDSQDAEFWGVR